MSPLKGGHKNSLKKVISPTKEIPELTDDKYMSFRSCTIVKQMSSRFFISLVIFGSLASAQTTLQVSSVAAMPGSSINVVLSVASVSGSQPLALQWDLIAPLGVTLAGTQPGASATSAGKTLSCAVNRCLLYGMNTTPMSDGAAAILTLNLAPTASGTLTVQPQNVYAAGASGSSIPITIQPGTISVSAPVSVSVTPAIASLTASQSQQFTASVTGGFGNTAVMWSISPSVGAITSTGLYTAPVAISAAQTVAVTATSASDLTKSASASVSLLVPVLVTASPATASLSASQSQQFTASVTGGSGNTAVTWSISPSLGAITSTGLYTAPSAIASAQTVTVTATSVGDPTKSAPVHRYRCSHPCRFRRPRPLPASRPLSPSNSLPASLEVPEHTAVTWSIEASVGAIASTGLYTAPVVIASAQTVTVTATSTADPTKSASASISLLAPVLVTATPAHCQPLGLPVAAIHRQRHWRLEEIRQ